MNDIVLKQISTETENPVKVWSFPTKERASGFFRLKAEELNYNNLSVIQTKEGWKYETGGRGYAYRLVLEIPFIFYS
jgi:hypothetical protein